MSRWWRIEIEGRRPGAEVAWSTVCNYGHFTAMQVRGGRTRGLALHLCRLAAANRELFDYGLDGERVRELMRHALRGVKDASMRVYIFESGAGPAIMVALSEPGALSTPQRLQSVRYQRPDPHLKHLATGTAYYSRSARLNGFDDALLTGAEGVVSEGATANIGFFDAFGVVWPDGPMLHGITMQLLERRLSELGMPARRRSVRLCDIPMLEGAFLSNARGVAALNGIDNFSLPVQRERMNMLADAYDAVAWDAI